MLTLAVLLHFAAQHVTIAWACVGNSYMMLDPSFNRWEHCTPEVVID